MTTPVVFRTSVHCKCGWQRWWSTDNPTLAANDAITLAELALTEHTATGKHLGSA